MAQFDANINLNVNNREALKGVTQVEGGINKLIKGVKEFERVFNEALNPKAAVQSRFQLEQEQKALRVFQQQNAALQNQVRLAAQLGSAYDKLQVKVVGTELRRLERARTSQKALPGAGFSGQRALPAAGKTGGDATSSPFLEAQRAAAAIDKLNAETVKEKARKNKSLIRTADAAEKIARAAEGEVSRVTRIAPPGSGPAAGVGSRGASGERFRAKLEQQVAREIAASGKLTSETEKLVNTFNKRQNVGDKIIAKGNELVRITDQQINAARQDRLDRRFEVTRRKKRVQRLREKKRRGQDALSSGIIGGAFPLLFGQGVGASLGGAAGGVGGGLLGGNLGFGLSLLGSALGTAFDDLTAGAVETAKSLNQPLENFKTLNEQLSLFDRASAQSIEAAKDLGLAEEANALIRQRISEVIGNEGIQKFQELNDANREYNRALGKLNLKLQEFVAGPLTEFIKLITQGIEGTAQFQENNKRGASVFSRLSEKDANDFLSKIAKARVSGGLFKGGGIGNQEAVRKVVEEFEKRFPAPIKPLTPIETTPQERSEQELNKLKTLQTLQSRAKKVLDIADKYGKIQKKQQEQQDNYDRQRVEIVRSYEQSIAQTREKVEQRILSLRIQGIQKANEIENQRAANRLAELQRSNRSASQQQRESAVSAGTRPELAATAQTVDDAFRAIAEAELSTEQKKAQIKRDAAFEVLKLELDGEKFKIDVAKEVSRLNLDTARRIERINIGIAKKNEDFSEKKFNIEKAIANVQLEVIKQENALLIVQLRTTTDFIPNNLGYQNYITQLITNIETAQELLAQAKPPGKLSTLAPVGGEGVSTAGADTALNNLIERQRILTAERLKSLDILNATNKEAELAKVSNIRIEDERAITSLLTQQKDALDAQQRVLELQTEGRSEAQAVAIQQVESAFELRDANLGVLDAKLRTQLAALENVAADKQDLETITKVRQELEKINTLRGGLPANQQKAINNAAKLNEGLTETEQLATEIGGTISNGITDALVLAVSGTENLGEAFQALAADILQAVGKALILAAVTKAIGAVGSGGTPGSGLLGLLFRANGGPVSPNQPYVVGEEGPELFIPGVTGTVTNNDQFEAARKAMGGSNNSSSDAFADNAEAIGTSTSYTKEKVMERERIASINSNPIDVRTETTVINNVEYVTVEQFSQGMKSTARDAQAKVLSDLRNRPSTRAQVGIR